MCDGVFCRKRFFTCEVNCGVFVAIHKLRKDNNYTPSHRYDLGFREASPMKVLGNAGLKEGDRIVWLSYNGPEFGVVKWMGILPDTSRRDVTVGVELVNVTMSQCNMH